VAVFNSSKGGIFGSYLGVKLKINFLSIFEGTFSIKLKNYLLGPCKRLYKSLRLSVHPLVRPFWSVHPHITLNEIFLAVRGRIDLKFGKDLHINLLFQFLLYFPSTTPLTPPCPPRHPPCPQIEVEGVIREKEMGYRPQRG
jgi:hypothetical protein